MQNQGPPPQKSAIQDSLVRAVRKLHGRNLLSQPILLLVIAGAVLVSLICLREASDGVFDRVHFQIAFWMWVTVFLSVLSEVVGERQGQIRLKSLLRHRDGVARRVTAPLPENVDGAEETVPSACLAIGDVVVCEADDIIPADGEVISGVASVDESAITGESAPVVRESGEGRSAVTGGTRVTSNRIFVRVTALGDRGFLKHMISVIQRMDDPATPMERRLRRLLLLLAGLTITGAGMFALLAKAGALPALPPSPLDLPVLAGIVASLLPLPVGVLVSAVGTAGLQRLLDRNIIPTSRLAMEKAADVDVLLLDKSGPITLGYREAVQFLPAIDVDEMHLAEAAQLASLADETPEGRSIVVLAKERFGVRPRDVAGCAVIPFSAITRVSGIDLPLPDGHGVRCLRKGDAAAVKTAVISSGGRFPHEINVYVEDIAREGGTPLVVAEGDHVLGVVFLIDAVKGGMRERFARLRQMGIRTVMVTGDNATTAAAIAAEAGVDDFMARATPEARLLRIREEQAAGHVVAVTGYESADAPALAAADVGVAMITGTQAARHAGNMVDLGSNPTRLIDIVETAKEVRTALRCLTAFTLAASAPRLAAIVPALLSGFQAQTHLAPASGLWNPLQLSTPTSAILSTLIFNALLIPAAALVAMRGVPFSHSGSLPVIGRHVLLWSSAGLVLPALGIKLADAVLTLTGWG